MISTVRNFFQSKIKKYSSLKDENEQLKSDSLSLHNEIERLNLQINDLYEKIEIFKKDKLNLQVEIENQSLDLKSENIDLISEVESLRSKISEINRIIITK